MGHLHTWTRTALLCTTFSPEQDRRHEARGVCRLERGVRRAPWLRGVVAFNGKQCRCACLCAECFVAEALDSTEKGV